MRINKATYDKETAKALRLSFDNGMKVYSNVWLPKSRLKFIDNISPTQDHPGLCTFDMPKWLLKDKTPIHVYSNVSAAHAVANFITKTGGDVHCTA
tara:strand:+ start:1585 stop:1872 length:288 start_codon:yes stop_codon:yes gene_type:complete